MTEFELKLEVPAARVEHVAAAFKGVPRKRMRAQYFDNAKFDLARNGVVVRVRKEGHRWVQTAKAKSGRSLERLEHNVDVPRAAAHAQPVLDLARHAGTTLEQQLRGALGLKKHEPFPLMHRVFEIDVHRQVLNLKSGRSHVEVAFDQGKVDAGDETERLCEVEFELKSGRPQDAIALAQRWSARHGLWLSSTSKSAKAMRLIHGANAAVTASEVTFDESLPVDAVCAAMIHNCLEQILPNASDVAGGSADRERVHQLRVGIRRLRTVLKEMHDAPIKLDPEWDEELARTFRVLGQHRDHEFLKLEQQPQLEVAGGPFVHWPALESVPSPLQAVRSPGFQRTLMAILASSRQLEPHDDHAAAASAKALVRQRLRKLHHHILQNGRHFEALDDVQRHRLRKQAKRMRYLAELAQPLFDSRQVTRFIRGLKPVQQSLGAYNDAVMTLAAYRELAPTEPRAWFGAGWLSAGLPSRVAQCRRDLDQLRDIKVFW